jgi:glycogen(starch) synthase
MSETSESANRKKCILFEVAWEVANKVGGIYTVIKTKVPVTAQEFKSRYCLIGPLSRHARLEVESLTPPANIKDALDSMHGVGYLYGRWLIESGPCVLLFDVGSMKQRLNEWKMDLWEKLQIPCPQDFEMEEAIVFGYIVTWFLGEYSFRNKKYPIVAHFQYFLHFFTLVNGWHLCQFFCCVIEV